MLTWNLEFTLFLRIMNLVGFYLCPYKICLFYFFSESPPILSSFEESLNEHWVVSMPDINFIFFLDVFRKFNSQLIRKRYFPDKIIIVISLKGWGEGLDSTESWSFLSQGFGFAHHEIFQNFGVLLLLFFHSLRFHRKGDVFSEICFGDHGCFHIRILRDRNQAYFLHI